MSNGRAALYHRVSTVDQNPQLARAELHAAAARLGYAVALDIEETGSGARNDRPGLRRVMDAAQRGEIDAVVSWKLDRFGRSALDLLANMRELEGRGVRFLATTQGVDIRPGGDAMSRLLLIMLAGVAEFERDLIRERTRLGLEAARRRGARLGRKPTSVVLLNAAAELVHQGEAVARAAKLKGISRGALRRYLAGKGGAAVAGVGQ